MAQIWLTYDELGELFGHSPARMRTHVIERQWTRRRSRDGLTRVKLPPNMMWNFIMKMASQCDDWRQVFADGASRERRERPTFGRPGSLLTNTLDSDEYQVLN
jgi:hypothetical protein